MAHEFQFVREKVGKPNSPSFRVSHLDGDSCFRVTRIILVTNDSLIADPWGPADTLRA
jgi:hypothetical protein